MDRPGLEERQLRAGEGSFVAGDTRISSGQSTN
jgi:hypothetical protein